MEPRTVNHWVAARSYECWTGQGDPMRRMRTRTFTAVAFVLAIAPGLLIYGLARTSLYDVIVTALGAPAVLAIALVLLGVLVGLAVYSLAYGFSKHERTAHRARRSRTRD